ncbi:hypothetical protein GZH49_12095 [Nocardia terpenica]|uniref:hypothetical protein n=1 Tax=Nocardia terpenica TaxID=455432 RepID=UPI002FE2D5CD
MGIWVVCLLAHQIAACQFVGRLDVDPVAFVPAESTAVVLVAVAPCRVSDPVIARVDVVHDFLCGHGLDVRAVYVPALVPGGMWTSLRGTAIDGIVPLDAMQPPPVRRTRRLPFLGRGRSRWTAAAMAPLAALVLALPFAHAAPTGQPGIAPPRPGAGQAGVTAPPSAASVAAAPPARSPRATGSRDSAELASAPASTSGASSAASSLVAEPGREGDVGYWADQDTGTVPPDVVRAGAMSVPRPGWFPEDLAASERSWNGYATSTAAAALTAAGIDDPVIERVLGTGEGEPAAVLPEWEPVAAILPDPVDAVAGLPGPVLDQAVPLVTSVSDATLSIITQLAVTLS